jgi:hypothetical protein
MAHADYPPPIVLCSTTSTGIQPDILDISAYLTSGFPPVLSVYISATATVKVWGALSLTGSNPATLVRKIDYSNGGFTTSDSYDMIPGVNFYQIEVTANSGQVVVECGVGPQLPGRSGQPQLIRMTTNATQGM